jgi:hypothetical protein
VKGGGTSFNGLHPAPFGIEDMRAQDQVKKFIAQINILPVVIIDPEIRTTVPEYFRLAGIRFNNGGHFELLSNGDRQVSAARPDI